MQLVARPPARSRTAEGAAVAAVELVGGRDSGAGDRGVMWGATTWLLVKAAGNPAAEVEAIKTGLGIGAGTAGVFALLLAVRRQWHQEITAADTTSDATERRVTDLYTKAVEQLGSDKAPVRLGGLYALERLAQDNAAQRQTIVNVLCAYLRMPYTLPGDPPADDVDNQVIERCRERVQEREVRLAAQPARQAHGPALRHLTPQHPYMRDQQTTECVGTAAAYAQPAGRSTREPLRQRLLEETRARRRPVSSVAAPVAWASAVSR